MSPYLKNAYGGLEPAMADFLENFAPDWVIYDVAPYWLPPIAAKLGVSCAYFCTFSAWSIVFFGSAFSMITGTGQRKKMKDYTVAPEWVPFKSSISLRPYELMKNSEGIKENPSGVLETFRFDFVISGCDVFLMRSREELESDWLKVLRDIQQKTILPLELLPLAAHDSMEEDETWMKITE
ncbi:putative UDP-rhamnose:rhamnosyltransferase 1 [Camellia lanceoleosa]|nr:putative UDP-rhamnose:rhamnosyltransferase 1 [Camellia lanceoleosa]